MIIVDVDETECNHTIHEIVREPLRFRVKRKCVKENMRVRMEYNS